MPSTPDELALIQAAQAGSQLAFQELMLLYCDDLQRHIQARLPNSARASVSAEDILQDTLVDLCRDFADFRLADGGAFRAWSRGVAEHRLADTLRFLNRKKRGGDRLRVDTAHPAGESRRDLIDQIPATASTPSVRLARSEANEALRIALETLPEQHQIALRMRFFDGCSYDDIATTLQCSTSAVQGILRRGKQKLAETMGAGSRYV
ncbi:MAG: RNA polymerase sigma factor [Pirellulaceae bacterium]|jgi:RNA polymerase sigma-70 factor (ECF subfamily)|nr:RNA polymerase sigma factor [Pirellulaceae bacterium]MDP7016934.1 RNA polymerase sigma factor [Pirellulaceae bacterium]